MPRFWVQLPGGSPIHGPVDKMVIVTSLSRRNLRVRVPPGLPIAELHVQTEVPIKMTLNRYHTSRTNAPVDKMVIVARFSSWNLRVRVPPGVPTTHTMFLYLDGIHPASFWRAVQNGNAPHWKCGSLTGTVRSSRTLSANGWILLNW